jgi:hypothetical protein
MNQAQSLVGEGRYDDAEKWLSEATLRYGESTEMVALRRFISIQSNKISASVQQTEGTTS